MLERRTIMFDTGSDMLDPTSGVSIDTDHETMGTVEE